MATPPKPFSNTAKEIIGQSPFKDFPPTLIEQLLKDAIRIDIPVGSTLYQEEAEPRCGMVIAGLIRVFMTSPDGRQVTVRYVRTGDILGLAAITGGPAPVNVQVIVDSTLLILNNQTLQNSGRSDPKVGWLIAEELTRRLYEVLEALAGNTFSSVRQRVARHLLDLAASNQQSRELTTKVTQQELADAVGSVRPVVARTLKELREEGLIETIATGILIIQPIKLLGETWSRK